MPKLRTSTRIEPPYPERSLNGAYPASAIARFASGFERDLIAWGATCSGNDRLDRTSCCTQTQTYLDAGRPHCLTHLLRYCKHGETNCLDCPKKPAPPTIIPLTTLRAVRNVNEFNA